MALDKQDLSNLMIVAIEFSYTLSDDDLDNILNLWKRKMEDWSSFICICYLNSSDLFL